MKRHLRIFLIVCQHVLNYRARNFVWFLESLLNPLVLMLFWQGAVVQGKIINNWSINDIRIYYLYIMIASVFLMHSVESVVSNYDIKEGKLEAYLLKPFSYSILRFYSEAPWRFIQFFYALITFFVLTFFFHIHIPTFTDPLQLSLALLVVVLAYFLSYLVKIVIAFTTFWLTDIQSIVEINDLLIIMLAGLILPIPFLPLWMQTIANFTPYPYIIYYPTAAFVGLLNTPELINVVGVQAIFIIFFSLLYVIIWKRGLKVFTGVGQ